MKDDTLINDVKYHSIWSLPCEIQGEHDTILKFFTRVDNSLNQWLRTTNGVEHKIFNYSLELYDTFEGFAYWHGDSFLQIDVTVVEVGTIETNGVTRKYWALGNEYYSEPTTWWIEGVGPTESLLSVNLCHTDVCGWYADLLCAWNNNNQIFDNSSYSYCEYFSPSYNNRISLFATKNTIFSVVTRDSNQKIINCNWVKIFNNTGNYMPDFPPPDNYHHMLWVDNLSPSNPMMPDLLIKAWEDSLLYFGPPSSINNLIFDYKSTIGDTLAISAYNYSLDTFINITAYVTETGYVNTEGVERAYWEITNEHGSTKWIQGLGNSEGILNPNWNLTGIDTEKYSLLCSWLNNVQIYKNPAFDSCFYHFEIPIDSIPEEPEDSIIINPGIYPNPFTNTFSVCQNEGNYIVIIYNSTGEKILHIESDLPDCPINMSGFNSGIYYLCVIKESGVSTTKILKI